MKKWIACVLAVSALSILLCGCGAGMDGSNAVVETPWVSVEPSMTMSPMQTPNAEDGIVDDRDGFIDETDRPSQNQQSQNQPSPAVTAPGTNTRPTT